LTLPCKCLSRGGDIISKESDVGAKIAVRWDDGTVSGNTKDGLKCGKNNIMISSTSELLVVIIRICGVGAIGEFVPKVVIILNRKASFILALFVCVQSTFNAAFLRVLTVTTIRLRSQSKWALGLGRESCCQHFSSVLLQAL